MEVVDFARARRTKLAGSYGREHVHNRTFYGFRLHARVNDAGELCEVLLRGANEHDVKVALERAKRRVVPLPLAPRWG